MTFSYYIISLKSFFFRGPLITNLAHRSSESMWPPLKSFPYYSKHSFGNLENNEMFITRLASNPETQEEAAVAAGVPWLNFRPISHHRSSKPKQIYYVQVKAAIDSAWQLCTSVFLMSFWLSIELNVSNERVHTEEGACPRRNWKHWYYGLIRIQASASVK